MTTQCTECGARWAAQDNCTEKFHRFLALEFTDPDYGAVHHLTVPTYMLQHPSRFSLTGWQAMRELLVQFLDDDLSPAAVRARNRESLDSLHRSWSFKKGPRLKTPSTFAWTQTILEVDDTTAAQYCKDIEQWARQTLADTARLKVLAGKEHDPDCIHESK